MSEYLIQGETLDDIADAINAKTGGSSAMTPAQMVTAIAAIPSGGGGSGYAKKTGSFVLATDYTYANTAAGAYTGSILVDTGLSRIDSLIVWSEEWADGTETANCFGLSMGFNNAVPTNSDRAASPFQQYSGWSCMRNGATRKYYGSDLQGIIFHNSTNGVPEGKFGLRCHTSGYPIMAGHTIRWEAWGAE